MWNLIWNNIIRRRSQSMLTVTITALTVLTFVVVFGVFQTMRQGLARSQERLGADVVILPADADADGYELLFSANPEYDYMSAGLTAQIAGMDGVAAASPQFYSQTLSGSCCDFGEEMRVVGIDPDTDFILAPYLAEQRFDRLQDHQVVLGGNFMDIVLGGTNILDHQFATVGKLYPTGTGMDDTVFMTLDKARQISAESPGLAFLWKTQSPADLISVIMVKLEDGVDPQAFAAVVERDQELGVQCVVVSNTVADLRSQLEATMGVLFALWMALLVIAALALVGRFNALAKDRKKEIGLLRAIGVQKGQVFGLVLGEAGLMALLGGLLGSIIGCLCMGPAIARLKDVFYLSASIWDWKLALPCGAAGVLLACLLGFAAAVWPAAKSAALEPQTAITQGEMN